MRAEGDEKWFHAAFPGWRRRANRPIDNPKATGRQKWPTLLKTPAWRAHFTA